jgi:aminoglycoside phosphotransferase (APT) family kinase protein
VDSFAQARGNHDKSGIATLAESHMTVPLDPGIQDWIAQAVGGEIRRLERMPGGNRRQAWIVDIDKNGIPNRLFLRLDASEPILGDPYTLKREAAIYQGLAGADVRIPQLVAVHPGSKAMLVQFMPGSNVFHNIADAVEKAAVARDFMEELARLHRLNPSSFQLGLGTLRCIKEHVEDELAVWDTMYRSSGRADPLLECALKWLKENVPDVPRPGVIVHGDAGPGNFLHQGGKIAALLDWELTHLGDPMEDLAWLSMRSVLEPFPDFDTRLREYEAAAGAAVDRERILYHRVFVECRVVILRHAGGGSDVANSLMSRAMNRRLLVRAIADAMGIMLPAVAPIDATDSECTPLYDSAIETVRDVVMPRLTDAFCVAKGKSLARVLKHLRERDRLQKALADRELEDLREILGRSPPTAPEGQMAFAAAIRSGTVGVKRALEYLARDVARETQAMQSAMGALATRGFPPI